MTLIDSEKPETVIDNHALHFFWEKKRLVKENLKLLNCICFQSQEEVLVTVYLKF